MAALRLALLSLWNRRTTALLTLSAIAVSVMLLLGVQKLRVAAKEGFASTISGVDLIVGARGGPLNLLLYSVFHVGEATAGVSWASYRRIASHPDVAWTIPLSLGDSYRGFRVLGTSEAYFEHYRFAGDRHLSLQAGRRFGSLREAVLGAEVARALGLRLGQSIVVSHGLGAVSFVRHEDQPFRIVGILARTGTPVDRTVHVSLESMSAIHRSWQHGSQVAGDAEPAAITAFLVGMRAKVMTLTMQRAINEYRQEPLLAIIPGVALTQLWQLVGIADAALMIVAAFVVFAGLLGMLTAILTSLGERRREMAILRSVGARPRHVFSLMVFEAGALAALGVLAGVVLTYAALALARPLLESRFGIFLPLAGLTRYDLAILAAVVAAALLVGLLPAWRAYRNTLDDGLTLRV